MASCELNSPRAVKSDGSDGDIESFIECKARKGYVIAVGSPVEVHPNRTPYQHIHGCPIHQLPVLDRFYADKLLDVGRLFNQVVTERTQFSRHRKAEEEPRPGDVYNLLTNWGSLLIRAGWSFSHSIEDVEYWRRPGKTAGHSAQLGYFIDDVTGVRQLSVFSTALPYGPKDEKPIVLSPFEFFSLDVFKGDWAQATLEAVEQYGPQIDTAQATWRQENTSSDSGGEFIMDVDLASDVEPEDIDWLWPQFLPLGKSPDALERKRPTTTTFASFSTRLRNGRLV